VPRRHDADAGGDATLLAAKAQLRDDVSTGCVCVAAIGVHEIAPLVGACVTGADAGSAHRLASRPARSRTREAYNGGGFSDLELAVAAEAGLIDPSTVVVTTVHELQVRRADEIPTTAHDIHVDVIVTPERVIECARPRGYRAPRLRWPELTDDKIAAIPLLWVIPLALYLLSFVLAFARDFHTYLPQQMRRNAFEQRGHHAVGRHQIPVPVIGQRRVRFVGLEDEIDRLPRRIPH